MNVQERKYQWIQLEPLDSLFFRSSDSMIAGESHEIRTIFPPLPSTLVGAIRATILSQRGIPPSTFVKAGNSGVEELPLLGSVERPGFQSVGPLFAVKLASGLIPLIPVPINWYVQEGAIGSADELEISLALPLPDELRSIGLQGTVSNPLWVMNPQSLNLITLENYWMTVETLQSVSSGKRSVKVCLDLKNLTPKMEAILPPSILWMQEERVGIALEDTRRAKQGHLYATSHIRLAPELFLLLGVNPPLSPDHLDSTGILMLGGEQRLCRYCVESDELLKQPAIESDWVMTLSPLPWSEAKILGLIETQRASGPMIRIGGWDMAKGFHKPITSFFSAGSVFQVDKKWSLPGGFWRI